MTGLLHRCGASVAAHPWRTLLAWLAMIVLAFGLATAAGGAPADDYDVPGTHSLTGMELLREQFPGMSGAGAQVVVTDPEEGALEANALDELVANLERMDHIASVSPPRVSADGDTALVQVQYDVPVTHEDVMGNIGPLDDAVAATENRGLTVLLGGEVPGQAGEIGGTGELVGVLVAVFLLVLTFRSVVAAGLPLAGAFVGLAVGGAGITLLAGFMDVSTVAPTIATMVGLGVGIDYGLLMVNRTSELLRAGYNRREAAARANATAGRSVVIAGLTVLVSLLGLRLAGLPVYDSFGYTTAIVVTASVLTSITLVPALASAAGPRLLSRRERRGADIAPAADHVPLTAGWAQRVTRKPVAWGLAALVILLALAAPVLGMRTWPQDAGSQPRELEVRQAFDLIAEEYGAGANAPMLVAVDLEKVDRVDLPALRADLLEVEGVAAASEAMVSPSGGAAVIVIEPDFAASDARTTPLLDHLRDDVLPSGAELTGESPLLSEISVLLDRRLWLVIGFVVGVSVLLLMVMFRSVAVPLKAAALNLLSAGAAYGVMVAVFQWGWGAPLFGLDHAVPVSTWVPILMFTVLFGLSMDYEVFLMSRIKEDYVLSLDPSGSVVRGLSATGGVITAAAAIMVAVFLGFATEANVIVSMMGVGMAVAIAVDATLVRLVLVPATMTLLGHRAWWFPAWLDRRLPQLAAEVEHTPGEPVLPETDPAREAVPV